MSVLSTKTKARIGVRTAKQAAKHPKLAIRGAKAVRPVVWGTLDRAVPGVAVGAAVGASAMFFLDPSSGAKRRRSAIGLITPNGLSSDQHNETDADVEAGGPAHPAPGHMPPEHR